MTAEVVDPSRSRRQTSRVSPACSLVERIGQVLAHLGGGVRADVLEQPLRPALAQQRPLVVGVVLQRAHPDVADGGHDPGPFGRHFGRRAAVDRLADAASVLPPTVRGRADPRLMDRFSEHCPMAVRGGPPGGSALGSNEEVGPHARTQTTARTRCAPGVGRSLDPHAPGRDRRRRDRHHHHRIRFHDRRLDGGVDQGDATAEHAVDGRRLADQRAARLPPSAGSPGRAPRLPSGPTSTACGSTSRGTGSARCRSAPTWPSRSWCPTPPSRPCPASRRTRTTWCTAGRSPSPTPGRTATAAST